MPSSGTDNVSDLNELLSSSLSGIFSDGKLDETIRNHTERTEIEEVDDEDEIISLDGHEGDEDEDAEFEGSGNQNDEQEQQQQQQGFFKDKQRRRKIKSFFSPIKSLIMHHNSQKQKQKQQQQQKQKHQHKSKNTRSRSAFVFRSKRRTISFAKCTSVKIVHNTPKEIEEMWYNDHDYETMKQEVVKTLKQIMIANNNNNDNDNNNNNGFVENDHQTARGLELYTTKEIIEERKKYKIASRHIVFDEQEEQRLLHTNDPENVRKLYREATCVSLKTAQDCGQKDEEELLDY